MILAVVFDRLQTIREAAEEFSISPALLRKWVSDDVIQHTFRGKRILVNRDEVVRALAHGESWRGVVLRP